VDYGQIVWQDPTRGEIITMRPRRRGSSRCRTSPSAIPQISDGQLVWSGNVTTARANYEIFFYDGHGDTFDQITTNSTDDVNPQIDHADRLAARSDNRKYYYTRPPGRNGGSTRAAR